MFILFVHLLKGALVVPYSTQSVSAAFLVLHRLHENTISKMLKSKYSLHSDQKVQCTVQQHCECLSPHDAFPEIWPMCKKNPKVI